MKSPMFVVLSLLGLTAISGCDDATGQRRNAGSAIGGAGLIDPDVPASKAPDVASSGAASQPQSNQVPVSGAAQGSSIPPIPGMRAAASSPIPGLPTAAPSSPGTVTEPAAPGVTGKGNYKPGLLTTPVSVYFRAQEKLMFDQVKHAIDLFEGLNGRKPRSHEEFMKEIIEANQPVLKLPKLPEGHSYKYDPQRGELMVEHPG